MVGAPPLRIRRDARAGGFPTSDGTVNYLSPGASTNSQALISLAFDGDVSTQVRARISYAFRIFAAIYNYKVIDPDPTSSALHCVYSQSPPRARQPATLFIPSRYRILPLPMCISRLSKCHYADEQLFLFHDVDEATGNPDWLGEIFEWLSCSYEMAASRLDSVGRIPYAETIFAQSGISPRKPYANILMAWMENVLHNGSANQALPKAPSPLPNVDHIVLCSHDIDFCHTTKASAFVRLLKNLVISMGLYRSPSFFIDNLRLLLELFRGKRVGDYLPALIQEMELCGIRSTLFAVSQHGHPRDPNYQLEEIASCLIDARKRGFSVGLHGSYCSVVEGATLPAEAQALANATGNHAFGGRQHWLRFHSQEKLFREVERAGLIFDSSVGFAENVGFRSGASFAYPPYDFRNESPFNFLEFPLVLMDGGVEAECRASEEAPQDIADEVLRESRRWGWGGVSVVWHNPIEPIQVPAEINSVFWNSAKKRVMHRERWMSADQFFELCLSRYHNAGLLEGMSSDA
jgi:hypothetical protein